MTYKDQIKSPLWQRKRLEIMNEHDFKCQLCGDLNSELHIHHKKYINGRKIHEYSNDQLMCLCNLCHSKIHNIKIDEYISPIKIGWFIFDEDCFKSSQLMTFNYFVEMLQKSLKLHMLENIDCIIHLQENDTFVFPLIESNMSFALEIDTINFTNKEINIKHVYIFN